LSPSVPHSLVSLLVPRGAWKWMIFVGGAGLLAGVVLYQPGSPVGLWQADGCVGSGEMTKAVELYDGVADAGWSEGQRAMALRRSAALLAADLDRPVEAAERLERLLLLVDEQHVRASLYEQIARLAQSDHQQERAGTSFLASYREAPNNRRAAERLTLAARSRMDTGAIEVANDLWDELANEFPERRAVARLAQAESALSGSNAQLALARFKEAQAAAVDPAVSAAARLGLGTALERLGNLDGAIAEIDQSQLPGDVRDSRVESLRARRFERDRE
jgi:tetratricopeptide (TPR) repeat protein